MPAEATQHGRRARALLAEAYIDLKARSKGEAKRVGHEADQVKSALRIWRHAKTESPEKLSPPGEYAVVLGAPVSYVFDYCGNARER